MTKILFVCLGNICRSPMAEYMCKDMVKKAGMESEFEIASAAVSSDEVGNPVYPPARRKLAEHGISCCGHAAHKMSRAEYDDYDYVICMDNSNLHALRRLSGGDPDGKISLLLDHCGREGQEISDPWYTGDFDAAWRDIYEGLEGLLNEFQMNSL